MDMTFEKKIGKRTYAFTVTGKNLHELAMEKEKLSFVDVEKCGLCQSDLLDLRAYLTKDGVHYVKIQCWKCGGSVTFGHPRKSPDTSYLRKTEDGKVDWQPKPEDEKK